MADEDVGGINISLDVDTSGLRVGSRTANKELSSIEKEAQRTTQAFKKIGETARSMGGILAGIGLGAGFGQSIQSLISFQNEMSSLRAVSKATEEQMASFEDQARQLGATTAFGANQAAQAQKFLAQAGLGVNEVLGATPSVLQLAQAGMLNLGQAADLATDIMAQMGLEVGDLNRINDVLVKTSNSATTNVSQLGDAFSYAGPIANDFGLSLEETSSALGVISSSGLKASRAGTGFLGVLRQLGNVTDDAQSILESYGISLADVDVASRGMTPVLQTLADASLSASERIKIFGSEASGAAAALINGIDAYRDQTAALGDVEGAAADAAKTMTDNLGGSLKGLQSAVSEANLQLGDGGLNGALNGVIVTATGVIQAFNGMTDEWAEANEIGDGLVTTVEALESAITIMAAAAAGRAVQGIGAMVASKVAANGATLTLTGSLRTLRTVMLSAFGPAGLVLAGVAALGQLGEAFDTTKEDAAEFKGDVDAATEALKGFSETALVTQIAALAIEFEKAQAAAEQLAETNTELSRGNGILGGSIDQVTDQIDGISETGGNASEKVRDLKVQLQGLKNALDLVRSAGGSDGGGGGVPSVADGGGRSSSEDAEGEEPDKAGSFAGGIGIFGEDEAGAYLEMLRQHQEERQSILREFDELDAERQEEKFKADMERLEKAKEAGIISEEEYQAARNEVFRKGAEERYGITANTESGISGLVADSADTQTKVYAAAFDTILSAASQYSKTAFEIQKGLAIANAVIKGYEAATAAWAWGMSNGGPPVAAAVTTASVAVTGAQIMSIKSQQFSGGTSSGGSGGGGTVSAGGGGGGAAQAQQAQQPAAPQGGTLTVQGINSSALFTGDAVRELAEELISYQKRGGTIVVE